MRCCAHFRQAAEKSRLSEAKQLIAKKIQTKALFYKQIIKPYENLIVKS